MNKAELTPRQVVKELDKYIIGQDKAKKIVAIALRNRWRRQQIKEDIRDEVMPNNIIMIGPTGVGKTEIARRLAHLAHAPFIKVEASKYTEVGYVGRDVESMARDLTDLAVNMVKEEKKEEVKAEAQRLTEERLLDLLLPPRKKKNGEKNGAEDEQEQQRERTREKLREQLKAKKLEERPVELELPDERMPHVEVFSHAGSMEEIGISIQEMIGNMTQKRKKRRKMRLEEARRIILDEEIQKLLDMDKVIGEAIHRVEQTGIIFIDEIDKIAGREHTGGPDVSREGVQRDLLPIVEGCTVATKYGMVKTDHVLFVAAGAFHVSKPSDLIPEMQGRFPIRVELDSLTAKDFVRILTEPKNALIKQYTALMKTEDIDLVFTKESIEKIADIASRVNEKMENIGARRLHTVMTLLLEEILFEAPELKAKKITITGEEVSRRLEDIIKNDDLSRYIL